MSFFIKRIKQLIWPTFVNKKNTSLVWLHIMNNQYRGVIGTGRTRKHLIKGEDTS